MSYVAERELEEFENGEAKFAPVARAKGWICVICGDTPSKSELDIFLDNGNIHPHCESSYQRFMRD